MDGQRPHFIEILRDQTFVNCADGGQSVNVAQVVAGTHLLLETYVKRYLTTQDQQSFMEPKSTKEARVLSAWETSHRTGILSIQGFTRCVISWLLVVGVITHTYRVRIGRILQSLTWEDQGGACS